MSRAIVGADGMPKGRFAICVCCDDRADTHHGVRQIAIAVGEVSLKLEAVDDLNVLGALAEVCAAPREGAVNIADDGIKIERARQAGGAVCTGGGGGEDVAIREDSYIFEGVDVD